MSCFVLLCYVILCYVMFSTAPAEQPPHLTESDCAECRMLFHAI